MRGFFKDVLDGKVREVRKWIEKGQNVGLYDDYGNTALHLAAEKGYRGVCKVLIDGGAEVNQKNDSVGWTAVHYAAYEGHSDVLRMLIAHGAIPDSEDKSGDTAETYASEWENVECIKILREATSLREASKHNSNDMYDSDDRSQSEDSDEDEDESSMMNWVIPPPSMPNVNVNLNKTTLVNNQMVKTMNNLSIDSKTEEIINDNQAIQKAKLNEENNNLSDEDIHLSVHIAMPTQTANKTDINEHNDTQRCRKKTESDSLPDLSFEDTETVNKNKEITDKNTDDDDTATDDTLILIKKSEDIKASKDSTFRTVSIVDRIKNTLSPATTPPGERKTIQPRTEPDIDQLLDISTNDPEYKQVKRKMQNVLEETKAEGKSTEVQGQRKMSVARAFSQAKEIITRERSRTRATSQAKDANVTRGRSNLRETTIPRELLPLADHIFSMSSATIPDDMTMSCGSVFEKFTNDLEGSETEKEILLKRLKQLIETEGNQIDEDLRNRKEQLLNIEQSHSMQVDKLKQVCTLEEEEIIRKQRDEKQTMDERHSKEEERIQREIIKIEEELENILAPSQLLSSLTPTQKSTSVTKVAPPKPEITELEQELECCGCGKVCCPPTKIYQCPEGDLICEKCRGSSGARIECCPACQVELAGMVSRNKVLENIAKKYFKGK